VDPSSSADDAEEHVVTGEDVPGADASMANRIIATAIDAIVAFGLNVGASIVLSRIPGPAEHLSALVGVAYLLTRDALPFLEGQSVGKKAMGIRAVTTAGKPLTGDWQPCLIRNGVLIIPFFALVELIVLLTRQDKPKPLLRLGDEWAHTKVINEGPAQ
jgi:uncharacterized RDD family membrane protein YckC